MVLEAVYEQDFSDCSYGFRPGRSAHQALERLRDGLTKMRGGVVIELDIKSFFDSMSHGHLRSFLDRRVRDGVIRRAIDKFHPDKTRMVPFGRPHATSAGGAGGVPGTFDFLGFTHYWGKSRKGYWVTKRKTAANRLRRALVTIGLWCREHRHDSVAKQQTGLNQKLRGLYGYYGIT